MTQQAIAIDLALPRTITMAINGRRLDYTFAPITRGQWFEYFSRIISSSERKGNEVVEEFDATDARLSLVSAALQSASGYATALGQTVESIDNWKEKLPIRHRMKFAEQLVSAVARDPEDVAKLSLGTEVVLLTSTWSANDDGVMQQFTQLYHEFKSPTTEQFRRYRRDVSRSYIVGGSRTAKTVWRGAQKTLAELYDELIVSVEGYILNGAPLTGPLNIAANMDTYHKVAAANHLFAPVETSEIGEVE
jgi:hypothetical protein